jgi:hypothetical protein
VYGVDGWLRHYPYSAFGSRSAVFGPLPLPVQGSGKCLGCAPTLGFVIMCGSGAGRRSSIVRGLGRLRRSESPKIIPESGGARPPTFWSGCWGPPNPPARPRTSTTSSQPKHLKNTPMQTFTNTTSGGRQLASALPEHSLRLSAGGLLCRLRSKVSLASTHPWVCNNARFGGRPDIVDCWGFGRPPGGPKT